MPRIPFYIMKTSKNNQKLHRSLIIQICVTIILLVLLSFSAYIALTRPASRSSNFSTAGTKYHALVEIPLVGPIANPQAEISGMSWYEDHLILLPQYPQRFGDGIGSIFALPKEEILAFLHGRIKGPLQPKAIPVDMAHLSASIAGFEGFEALAFDGDQAYLTIESKSGAMKGYLVKGTLSSDLDILKLSKEVVPIEPQANIDNFTDEALLIFKNKIYTFYEANGVYDNPTPIAHVFDTNLGIVGTVKAPNLEYRLTDASIPDLEGRFWVINYLFLGDLIKLRPGPDLIKSAGQINFLPTSPIERLVELIITDQGIMLSDRPMIKLALADNGQARNWEAIAVLDECGFLIATDRYPKTILGFVTR